MEVYQKGASLFICNYKNSLVERTITMKKILLVDASPRKDGNSEIIVDVIAEDLKDTAEIIVFKMREKKCNPCQACGACQGKESQMCLQKDDITELLPTIDECDAILLTTPIYNQQMTSQAKLFIERFYPFFHVEKKNMSNTSKQGKKAAMVCCCWGSPKDVTEKYAAWTVGGFSQIGAEFFQSYVFNQIPNKGDVEEHEDYMQTIHDLAKWLSE